MKKEYEVIALKDAAMYLNNVMIGNVKSHDLNTTVDELTRQYYSQGKKKIPTGKEMNLSFEFDVSLESSPHIDIIKDMFNFDELNKVYDVEIRYTDGFTAKLPVVFSSHSLGGAVEDLLAMTVDASVEEGAMIEITNLGE